MAVSEARGISKEDLVTAVALGLVVVAGDADRVDDAELQLPRDDRRGHQPATGDGDDALPALDIMQPPGQRLGVAVQLFPRNRKGLAERYFAALAHGAIILDAVGKI